MPARYNICPTDAIDVLIERGGQVDLVPMRWGLIPLWWMKTAKEVPATFNARAEATELMLGAVQVLARRNPLNPQGGVRNIY